MAGNLNAAVDFVNTFVTEHLEIMTLDPKKTLRSVRHAGSVFLGKNTPVAAGYYARGANLVLPT